MRAVYIQQHGGLPVLQYGEQPEPTPGPGEVKVQVRAAALNRLDLYTRLGVRGSRVPPERFPHILGGDCAGDIAETATDVLGLHVGQRVVVNPLVTCGSCWYCLDQEPGLCDQKQVVGTHRPGSYAEFVVVPASNVLPMPDGLSYQQAAALPTTFLPTWNIIVRKGKLQRSETALVLSGSSGVGTAAISIVKSVIGARCIVTTSSGEKAQALQQLGADHTIDYTVEDVARRVMDLTGQRGVDLVVDSVGGAPFEAASRLLAKGGRYGVCGVTSGYRASLHLGELFTRGLHLFGVFMGPPEDLVQVLALAREGVIHSPIHCAFPLHRARQAHELMESARHVGKLLLTVD